MVAELLRLPSVIPVDLAPLDPSALAEHLTATAPGRIDATELNTYRDPRRRQRLLRRGTAAASVTSDSTQHSTLPAGLAALLLDRVEQLSDAAQQVLRAAAVAGRKADDEAARALLLGLEAAEYEGAVRGEAGHHAARATRDRGYVFRHALLREAVYADLLPGADQAHATDVPAARRRAATHDAGYGRGTGRALPGQP